MAAEASDRGAASGPRPATSRPEPGPTGRRLLQRIADRGGHQVSLADVHHPDDGHPNTTRRVLGALTRDGLLTVESVRRTGPGRPANAWSITPAGRSVLDGTDEATTVVGVIASYLVESVGPEAAHALGLRWSEAHGGLLDGAADGVDGLVEVLDALGFAPLRRNTEEGETVLLRSCPLLGPAVAHPEVVCQMHRGMVDGMVQRLGARQGVDLLPFADPQGCTVEITEPDD